MKRVTKALSIFICLMMVVGVLVPMAGVASASPIRSVGSSTALLDLLAGTGSFAGSPLADGDTINITSTFSHATPITLTDMRTPGITISINANVTFTLEASSAESMLELDNSILNVTGSGTLVIRNTAPAATPPAKMIAVAMDQESELNNNGATVNISAADSSIDVMGTTAKISNISQIGPGAITASDGVG